MLEWINKKLKMTLVKAKLRQNGCESVYPDPLLQEIVDTTFFMTKSMSQSNPLGGQFDFDGNWNWFIEPYIKLLIANAMITATRGRNTDEQIREALILSGGEEHYALIDPHTDDFVESLFEQYGIESQLAAIRPIFAG